MTLFKEVLKYYRQRKYEEKEKKRLITAKTNFHLLEQLVQKVNDNPELRITVTTADGTKLELYTVKKERNLYAQITGEEFIN